MKFWFILIFILSAVLANAQTRLDGKYCRNDNGFRYSTDCIKFNPNGTFKYERSHCTGTDKGRGKYIIENGMLELNFYHLDSIPNKTSKIEMKQYDLAENEDASIKVTVIDIIDSVEIGFVHIDLQDSSNNTQINKATTDTLNGTASLKIGEANQLTISYIGYKELKKPIPNNKNIKLTVYLARDWVEYLSVDDSMSFPIKKIDEEKFLLKRYDYMDYINYKNIDH
jgi:hypothetical protein